MYIYIYIYINIYIYTHIYVSRCLTKLEETNHGVDVDGEDGVRSRRVPVHLVRGHRPKVMRLRLKVMRLPQ